MLKSHASAWASDAPTPAQIKEFFAQVESGKVTKARFQKFLRGVSEKDYGETLLDWQRFYNKYFFNQDKDFSGLRIPERREGFNRLIVVAEGMTSGRIFVRMNERMPAWKYWQNLDVIISDRKADHDYAIWVRDREEADEELKNKSANGLKKEGISGITLEERLLYELKFFEETCKHLDMDNVTLCAGSRDPDGGVPSVHWLSDEVDVDWHGAGVDVGWYSPDYRGDRIRARAAVS